MDTFKVEATNAILARLGDEIYENLKHDLRRHYKIELTKVSSFTLGELHTALRELLGIDSARLIIRTIYAEIERLADYETR